MYFYLNLAMVYSVVAVFINFCHDWGGSICRIWHYCRGRTSVRMRKKYKRYFKNQIMLMHNGKNNIHGFFVCNFFLCLFCYFVFNVVSRLFTMYITNTCYSCIYPLSVLPVHSAILPLHSS